jgi:5-methylcytosine-specific restriction enzyme subunit McrC
MAQILEPNSRPAVTVDMVEWDQVGPAQEPRLMGTTLINDPPAKRLADALRNRVDIREGYEGLEITSTSFVGRVDVGPLRIAIRPKLPAMPLARLLRYAYGLRDITTIEETRAPTARHGLHDLLISMLAAEVEELLHRGLARRYIPLSQKLASPRGGILIDRLIRDGGVTEARLPCRYFERHVDWQLNQVLRAGLDGATRMSEDRDLRRRMHRLAAMFAEVERKPRLDIAEIDRAERGLTRLTAANAPALTIIRLLHDMLGVAFKPNGELSRTPGFLFDMNIFFQRLLSRFLHENLTTGRIEDEWPIRKVFAYGPDANPRQRTAPAPRPDYALFDGKTLRNFLDAKYRDIWEQNLPAEWLYQLSIYALSSPAQVSVLLYASTASAAADQRVDFQPPMSWPKKGAASVILRAVPLQQLASLLDPSRTATLSAQRHAFADGLVLPQARSHKDGFHEALNKSSMGSSRNGF